MSDYTHFIVQPDSGALGATVSGLDLSRALPEAVQQELYAAWLQYQVLFFEEQQISLEQFKTFVRYFGELEVHSFIGKAEGDDTVEQFDSIAVSAWAPSTAVVHIDVSMYQVPTKGAALYAVDVPSTGGDTIWVNAYAAYDGLSPAMQDFLADKSGLFVTAHGGARDAMLRGGPATAHIAKGFLQKPAAHPLVHTHPESGRKALFVDSLFMWSIEDLKPAESDALCRFLFQHVTRPEFQCRLHWRAGTLALWDNRCTMHSRVDDLEIDQARVMHRLPIKGETSPV